MEARSVASWEGRPVSGTFVGGITLTEILACKRMMEEHGIPFPGLPYSIPRCFWADLISNATVVASEGLKVGGAVEDRKGNLGTIAKIGSDRRMAFVAWEHGPKGWISVERIHPGR